MIDIMSENRCTHEVIKAQEIYYYSCGIPYLSLYFPPQHFRSIHLAMYNTMVMSLGEMEFLDAFTPNSSYYDVDNFIIFTIFIFIMPIVLMNLLVSADAYTSCHKVLCTSAVIAYILFVRYPELIDFCGTSTFSFTFTFKFSHL